MSESNMTSPRGIEEQGRNKQTKKGERKVRNGDNWTLRKNTSPLKKKGGETVRVDE